MRTRGMVGCIAAFVSASCATAQTPDWNTAGNVITSNEWFGANTGSLIALSFETRVNQPMFWRTNGFNRMRLSEDLTGMTVNTFTGLDLSGFLGVGNFIGAYPEPVARVHSEFGSSLALGYRPIIKEGFLATRGEALYYGGLLNGTNSGIIWSLATGTTGTPGVFRFIYTGDNTTATMASSASGLELARFKPAASLNEGFFGLGDWTTAGLDPTERLDLLDRTIRLRNFMTTPPVGSYTDYESLTLENVLVVDPADGLVHWRNANTFGACDWENNGIDDIVTAYLSAPLTGCPDETNMVGIGMVEPQAKLDVRKVYDNGFGTEIGIRSHMDLAAATKVAVEAINVEEATENFGLRSAVDGAERNWGVASLTRAGFQGGSVVAGFFHADGEYITADPIGVWGISANSFPTGGPGWAAWFDGYGYLSLGPWVTSDATLKQNIQPLVGCLDVVGAFAPKSFEFAVQDHPEMNLPEGFQAGIMAQDLQQVLPHLVRQAKRPGMTDSLGNVIAAPVDLLAVNYEGMIPYTIGAINEQQAIIVQLSERIETLEQQVAACCNNSGGDGQRSMSGGTGANDVKHTDLFIIPNPVADLTQLRYTIAAPGRTRLEIADSQGKRLEVLEEAVREVGSFEYVWNTQDLAPGTYQCILYVNDAFVVKKAVKVGR